MSTSASGMGKYSLGEVLVDRYFWPGEVLVDKYFWPGEVPVDKYFWHGAILA